MNQALFPASSTFSIPAIPTRAERGAHRPSSRRAMAWTYAWTRHEEVMRLRRLRSLLGLFALYAVALMALIAVSDGADIGCMLGGIAGHVVYATVRVVTSWRDAAGLEDAKTRTLARSQTRYAR
ncbi:MAG: hypothetical protein Q8K35_03170 [Thiobacillus sp.]|nr:hypothetical protein [Thiobacillus sp.]